jgi:GNAT superfamily N-acetyltransferase
MDIETVRNADELDSVLRLTWEALPQLANTAPGAKYSRDFWIDRMGEVPALLLYANVGGSICGSVFGWVENGTVTIGHCWVDRKHRGEGIGRALMVEMEKRARDLGCQGVALGAVESAEGFYGKLGYTGTLLVQSEEHSTEELLTLNTRYRVLYTNIYDGMVNQVCLQLPSADRGLQEEYEKAFPGCSTQMVFGKTF